MEYLDRFADTDACLYRLTGAKVKFNWSEEKEVKGKVMQMVLRGMSWESFITGSGGKERVVAYGSFVLSMVQRNYCVTRKELLVIVVFTTYFRHYLLGNKFKVKTDHNSLIWLMRFKNIEGQLARWIEELQNYDMELLYSAGRDHGNADGMLWLPDMG